MGKYFDVGEAVICEEDGILNLKTTEVYTKYKNVVGIVTKCESDMHSFTHGTLYMITVNFGDGEPIVLPAENLTGIVGKKIKLV